MAVTARLKVFLLGILCSLILLYLGVSLARDYRLVSTFTFMLSACLTCVTGMTTIILFHLASQPCSQNIAFKDLVLLYLFSGVLYLLGKFKIKRFRNATRNPRGDQEKLLFNILRGNCKTEYGRNMGFDSIATIDEFRKRHPLSKYDQFENYIERTAKGEDNVLLPKRPVQFVLTSGTTGKSKKIPISMKRKLHLPVHAFSILTQIIREQVPPRSLVQKFCFIYTHPTESWSEAGIVISALTRLTKKDILPSMATPWPGFKIRSEKEAMYIHALFALKDEHIAAIQAPFCTFVCNFFKVIENNWRDLANDISTGIIKADLNIPLEVRDELSVFLKPDPLRAQQLYREFERGFQGIAKRVWPHLQFLFAVVSPAFQAYADMLEQKYATGVRLWSCFYIASEGILGVNLWPKNNRQHRFHYVLFTNLTFFEFIPLEHSEEDQPNTLLIDELQEGKSYELALTNIDGLYRFRFGDVIKVAGFYNKSPIIEFQFRIGDLINLRGEKMTEDCLRRALFDTVASWEGSVIEYACAESHLLEETQGTGKPSEVPYYVIFVEIDEINEKTINTDMFDETLRNQVPMYDYYRKMGGIDKAKVILVQGQTFAKLRDHILQNSTAAILQFKMPRKLRKTEWVELLLENRL